MSAAKRHHIVPEFLLKNFTDADGFLHWARFSTSNTRFGKTKPTNIFVETNVYSSISNSGEKDNTTESWLNQIETAAAPIIKEVLSTVRNGKIPALSHSSARDLLRFFMVQSFRSPEFQKSVYPDEQAEQYLDNLLATFESQSPHFSELVASFRRNRSASFFKDVRAQVVPGNREHIVDIMVERGIAFLRVQDCAAEFIIGSRPVIKLTPPGRQSLTDPRVEMWLPLAPDVVIGLGRGSRQYCLLNVSDEKIIKNLNCTIAKQCSSIASTSTSLTKFFAQMR